MRTHAAESDIRTTLVLILVCAHTALQEVTDVLPTSALHYFAFQHIWVGLLGVVREIRIHIMNARVGCGIV